MPTRALETQRGHGRQEPVNVSCQKQIAVFPTGLAKPFFWRSEKGEWGAGVGAQGLQRHSPPPRTGGWTFSPL